MENWASSGTFWSGYDRDQIGPKKAKECGGYMYKMLVGLMAIAGSQQFEMTVTDFARCRSRACLGQIEQHSRDVLRIDWKPVTVWPAVAKRFK